MFPVVDEALSEQLIGVFTVVMPRWLWFLTFHCGFLY